MFKSTLLKRKYFVLKKCKLASDSFFAILNTSYNLNDLFVTLAIAQRAFTRIVYFISVADETYNNHFTKKKIVLLVNFDL